MTVVRFPVATPAAEPADQLQLRILGAVELRVAAQNRTPTAAKLRALLVTLALARGRRMTTESLIDELWASPPRTARNVLHTYVSQLRRSFAGTEARLTYEDGGYRLVLPHGTFDVEDFVERAAEVETVDEPPAQRARVQSALATWYGDPALELCLGPRAEAELAELQELRTTLIERRAALDVAAGQPDQAIAALRSVVAAEPLREHAWAELIGALAAAGRWAEALLAYEEVRGVLAEELGIEPSTPLRELHRRLLAQDGPVAGPEIHRRRRPPAATAPPPLLGRDADRRELERSMTAHRLVTLTGPAGVGKTALALDAAEGHGSLLGTVEVLCSRSRHDVLRAFGDALGVDRRAEATMEDLLHAARARSGLLILDGCEAQLSICAELVAALLGGAPRLRLLATSMEALRLRGERRLRVEPLEIPGAAASLRATRASPAVGLLIERARDNGWRAELDPPTLVGLGEIARELDGLPLALELAADRLVDLPVDRLRDRLRDRFQLLAHAPRCAPEHHRTLEAAVAANHTLLDGPEQAFFACLALFNGPFTAADALAVAGAPSMTLVEVEDALQRLLTTSMLQPAGPLLASGPVILSNTWRAFAAERLDELPQAREVRSRHAAWLQARVAGVDHTRSSSDLLGRVRHLGGHLAVDGPQAADRSPPPVAAVTVSPRTR